MKEQLKYLFDVLEGNTDYPFLNLALYLKSYQSILDNAGLRWRDQEMYKLGKMVLDDFEKGYDKNKGYLTGVP